MTVASCSRGSGTWDTLCSRAQRHHVDVEALPIDFEALGPAQLVGGDLELERERSRVPKELRKWHSGLLAAEDQRLRQERGQLAPNRELWRAPTEDALGGL